MSLAKLAIIRRQWVIESLCELTAVPDKQLRVWRDRFDGVEEDAEFHLARDQILLLQRVGWVDVPHPVAVVDVVAVYVVIQLFVVVHL